MVLEVLFFGGTLNGRATVYPFPNSNNRGQPWAASKSAGGKFTLTMEPTDQNGGRTNRNANGDRN